MARYCSGRNGPCKAFFFEKTESCQNRAISGRMLSGHKLQLRSVGQQAALETQAQKAANGLPAAFAVIQGPVVDVHADKPVGQITTHVPRVLEGVLDGLSPMCEAEANAGGEEVGHG